MVKLTVEKAVKRYNRGKKTALQPFSAELTPGIYGLLGPNGAGKSTLINLITGQLEPDEGTVLYNDQPIKQLGKQYRSLIGYMPQQQGLYHDFTGRRFLWYMAALKGLKAEETRSKVEELLAAVNLTDEADKKIGAYSGGMKQRILIAQALLNDPDLLIMDEPTAGLDPRERIRIRNLIASISLQKIVIIATHVVSDIEYIAKEVMLLKSGELLIKDTPANVAGMLSGKVVELLTSNEKAELLQKKYRVSHMASRQDGILVRIVHPAPEELRKSTGDIDHMQFVQPSLEDVYLHYFD